MTEPLRYQIVLAIQTALRAITGPAAGYFFTVKPTSVTTRVEADLWQVPLSETPYLVVLPDSEARDTYRPANQLLVEFPLLIVGRFDAPTGSVGTEKLQTWERAFADLERALTRDITLGGLVIDTRITERQAGIDVGSSQQVHVRVGVVTRLVRTYGQP